MKKVLVLAAVSATLLGSVALADSHGKGGMGMAGGPRMAQLSFADLDTNGDGQLTLEELTARPADHFASTVASAPTRWPR
jgi:hypothetical protein